MEEGVTSHSKTLQKFCFNISHLSLQFLSLFWMSSSFLTLCSYVSPATLTSSSSSTIFLKFPQLTPSSQQSRSWWPAAQGSAAAPLAALRKASTPHTTLKTWVLVPPWVGVVQKQGDAAAQWEKKKIISCTDINSWYTVDVNSKDLTVKLLEDNTRGYLGDLRVGRGFF